MKLGKGGGGGPRRLSRGFRALAAVAVVAATAAILGLPSAASAATGPELPPAEFSGDCAGEAPVVVASDAGAQSDIYSAVTLAGVLGSGCVVLAGPRAADMGEDQKRRLAAAAAGGYVVGGLAAVPDCKLAGRSMARIAGADRWATARAVGAEAKRIADGSPSTPRAIPVWACDDERAAAGFKAIAAGTRHLCALDAEGAARCWGRNDYGQARPPAGRFKAVSAGGLHTCAIRTNGKLACWGVGRASPPEGRFKEVSAGGNHTCAIRTDGNLACWGYNRYGQTDAPEGGFKAVAAGYEHTCAVRADNTLGCWGGRTTGGGRASPPEGRFEAVAAGGIHTCAIRAGGAVACWGDNADGQTDAPEGSFKAVAAGHFHTCAIRADNTLECWGRNVEGEAGPPEGRFKAITADRERACAIRADGTLACWGASHSDPADAPAGSATTPAEAEAFMAELVNELRVKLGLAPLERHSGVAAVARNWSQTMADTGDFKHNPDFAAQYPYGFTWAGENIAQYREKKPLSHAVRDAFEGLADSPGHYRGMTNPNFTHIGVGIAIADDWVWVTQNFAQYPPGTQPTTKTPTTTPEGDGPAAVVSKGSPGPTTLPPGGTGAPCAANAPQCRWVNVELRRFAQGTYTVSCRHDGWGTYGPSRFATFAITVGADGSATYRRGCYINFAALTGQGVHVTVTSPNTATVTSNSIK